MHDRSTAHETLQFLWRNYLTLCEQVDLESMSPEKIDDLVEQNAPVRPFRIAAWLARFGFFISAWCLWENYSRSLCEGQPNRVEKRNQESNVQWFSRWLTANEIAFSESEWFVSANNLRNLIAHYAARVDGSETRSDQLLQRSLVAFPDLHTFQDGYVNLTHEHVAELQLKIEEFISEKAPSH